MAKHDKRYCLICQPKNRTIYFHLDEKTGLPWLWCNKCSRGYSLTQYCDIAGINVEDFIKDGIDIVQNQDNEVNAMAWPNHFVPLSDPRAINGVEYLKNRNIDLDGDMYYDIDQEGIVFPYYFGNQFCGAQVRFINERIKDDGSKWKITTLPGTRLGLLIYGFNQTKFLPSVKAVVVTEGALNAICLQQAFNNAYGGVSACPWKFIALSGSGVSEHQKEALRELKEKGYKVIAAPDTDEAGIDMLKKLKDTNSITHYALTNDTEKDWNDVSKTMEKKNFVKWFLKQIQNVD
jgi:hypothetical protein